MSSDQISHRFNTCMNKTVRKTLMKEFDNAKMHNNFVQAFREKNTFFLLVVALS